MDYWNDIEKMPIWNYNKVQETGDLAYMMVDDTMKLDRKKAKDCWDDVRQQIVDRYGLDFELMDYYENIKRITTLKADLLITGERFLKNEIRLLEAQINEFESGEGANFNKVYMSIGKYLGYRFDPKSESVVSYKEVLLMMAEESSKHKKNQE